MYRCVITLVVLAVAAAGGAQDSKGSVGGFPFVGRVSANLLNVRLKPSVEPESTIVGTLKENDEVTIVEESGGFYGIQPPKGAWTWVHSKSMDVTSDTATATGEVPVRIDSRVTAPVVATLKAGTQVKIIQENLGWLRINAGDAVHFWVSKKYIRTSSRPEARASHPPVAPRSGPKAVGSDPEAHERIRVAEEMVTRETEEWDKGDKSKVDFKPAIALFLEAESLAKDSSTKQYAKNKARIYQDMQNVLVATNKGDQELARIREAGYHQPVGVAREKDYAFKGYLEPCGRLLLHRPGSHRLVTEDDRIVCFIKVREGEEDSKLLEKMDDLYKKYVGITGTVIQNPLGWPGYSVVLLDEIDVITTKGSTQYQIGEVAGK